MEKLEDLYRRLISEGLEKRDFSRPYKEVGIGGSYKLIDDLLNTDLEALECDLLTRIDYHSDTINR